MIAAEQLHRVAHALLTTPMQASRRSEAPFQVTVRGLVDADAQVRRTVHGRIWLSVTLRQPGGGVPVLAPQAMGDTAADDLAAHAKARLLKRGAGVIVHGRALRTDSIHGTPCLRVEGAEIVPMDVPPPRHEPAERVGVAS